MESWRSRTSILGRSVAGFHRSAQSCTNPERPGSTGFCRVLQGSFYVEPRRTLSKSGPPDDVVLRAVAVGDNLGRAPDGGGRNSVDHVRGENDSPHHPIGMVKETPLPPGVRREIGTDVNPTALPWCQDHIGQTFID